MSALNEDILSNTDIVDIVSRYVKLRKVGRNFSGLCPFHKEKSPSFTVAPDKQIFKCFGCGVGGNAIKFLMDIERIDYWEAIKILAKSAHVDLSKYKFDDEKLEKNVTQREKIKLINKYAQKFFVENLQNDKSALEYVMNNRKLSKETIEKFGIGYAPDNHFDLMKLLISKGFDSQDIQSAGLGKIGGNNETYAFFRNRIMFPIHDQLNNIVAFAGRAIKPNDMPKYLNTAETMLYDKSKILYGLNIAKNHIQEFNKLIVVEGYMDVIALSRANIPVGIASCGTALTQNHLNLAKRYTQNIILAFDNDNAGFQATQRALKTAYENDIFPQVFVLNDGYKDLDELINEIGEGINQQIESNMIDGFEFILKKLLIKYNIKSPIERKNILNDLFDMISGIKDTSIIMLYMEQLAAKFGVNYNILLQQFQAFKKSHRFETKQPNKSSNNNEFKFNEKYIIAALLYENFLTNNKINDPKINEIIELLIDLNKHFENQIISNVQDKNVSGAEKEELLQCQLWWEKQFDTLNTEKKIQEIIGYLKRQIILLNQNISKISNISLQDKIEISNKIKKIG